MFYLCYVVFYLGDLGSQNPRTDGSEVRYKELGYGATLISRHWILHRAPYFWGIGKCSKSCRKMRPCLHLATGCDQMA